MRSSSTFRVSHPYDTGVQPGSTRARQLPTRGWGSGEEAGPPAAEAAGQVVAAGGGQARDVVVDEPQVERDELTADERGRGPGVGRRPLAPGERLGDQLGGRRIRAGQVVLGG